MGFEQPTICFETEDKNGYPYTMLISPKYTCSDLLLKIHDVIRCSSDVFNWFAY